MKNFLSRLLGTAAIALIALTTTAQADPITGSISFVASDAANALPWSADSWDVDDINIVEFGDVIVGARSGAFESIAAGTAVFMDRLVLNNPQFGGWHVGLIPPPPYTPLWTVGGYSFSLTSLHIQRFGRVPPGWLSTLKLSGEGLITNGQDTATGTWQWSGSIDSIDNGASFFSFTSNNTTTVGVPDPASTAILVSLGLLGLSYFRRTRR